MSLRVRNFRDRACVRVFLPRVDDNNWSTARPWAPARAGQRGMESPVNLFDKSLHSYTGRQTYNKTRSTTNLVEEKTIHIS